MKQVKSKARTGSADNIVGFTGFLNLSNQARKKARSALLNTTNRRIFKGLCGQPAYCAKLRSESGGSAEGFQQFAGREPPSSTGEPIESGPCLPMFGDEQQHPFESLPGLLRSLLFSEQPRRRKQQFNVRWMYV
jgi:hypothetical protein